MITLYTSKNCPRCQEAKQELEKNKVPYEAVDILNIDGEVKNKFIEENVMSLPVIEASSGDIFSGPAALTEFKKTFKPHFGGEQ